MLYCILLLTKHKEYKLSEPLSEITQRRAVTGYILGSSFEQCLYKMYDQFQGQSTKGINSVCRGTVDEDGVFHPHKQNESRRFCSA